MKNRAHIHRQQQMLDVLDISHIHAAVLGMCDCGNLLQGDWDSRKLAKTEADDLLHGMHHLSQIATFVPKQVIKP